MAEQDFLKTTTDPEAKRAGQARREADDIVNQINVFKRTYQDARQERENKWLEAWGQYFSTPEAEAYLRSRALHTVGDVQTDWRHRVPDGKAFEMVESVTSFMMGAFFPNENWFEVNPQASLGMDAENYRKYLRLIKKFTNRKLEQGNFQDYWEAMTRQAVTIGTSAIALPWRYEKEQRPMNVRVQQQDGSYKVETKNVDKTKYNGFDFEVVSMFDFFIDPRANGANDGNILRRYERTRAELIREVEAGKFPWTSVKAIQDMPAKEWADEESETHANELEHFEGMEEHLHNPEDVLEVWEFWGDFTYNGVEYKDVVVTVAGDEVLEFQSNPFWGGKPFITMTFLPVLNSPYGLGVLDPVLGDLHAKKLARNQRLDIVEASINPMFEAVNDGTIDFSNLTAEPGKVIPVAEPGSIRQINTIADVGTSVQEEQLMEQSIEQATGTGAFIGSGATRNAERVTAQEIEATRSAGGNRLNGVHRHMEREGLLPFMRKAFTTIQQFMTEDEVVPVPREDDPETIEFTEIGVDELNQDLELKPRGADFIADKEFEIRQRTDFLNLASQIQPLMEKMNWGEIGKDLARRFLQDDWEKYVKTGEDQPEEPVQQLMNQGGGQAPQLQNGEQPAAASPPQSEVEQLRDGAEAMGGEPAAQAVEKQLRTGTAEQSLQQLAQTLEADRE